jgi:hypothetical protein
MNTKKRVSFIKYRYDNTVFILPALFIRDAGLYFNFHFEFLNRGFSIEVRK